MIYKNLLAYKTNQQQSNYDLYYNICYTILWNSLAIKEGEKNQVFNMRDGTDHVASVAIFRLSMSIDTFVIYIMNHYYYDCFYLLCRLLNIPNSYLQQHQLTQQKISLAHIEYIKQALQAGSIRLLIPALAKIISYQSNQQVLHHSLNLIFTYIFTSINNDQIDSIHKQYLLLQTSYILRGCQTKVAIDYIINIFITYQTTIISLIPNQLYISSMSLLFEYLINNTIYDVMYHDFFNHLFQSYCTMLYQNKQSCIYSIQVLNALYIWFPQTMLSTLYHHFILLLDEKNPIEIDQKYQCIILWYKQLIKQVDQQQQQQQQAAASNVSVHQQQAVNMAYHLQFIIQYSIHTKNRSVNQYILKYLKKISHINQISNTSILQDCYAYNEEIETSIITLLSILWNRDVISSSLIKDVIDIIWSLKLSFIDQFMSTWLIQSINQLSCYSAQKRHNFYQAISKVLQQHDKVKTKRILKNFQGGKER